MQLPGMICLSLFSKVQSLRAKIAESGTNGFGAVLTTLNTWLDDVDITRSCLKTLMRLAGDSKLRVKLGIRL